MAADAPAPGEKITESLLLNEEFGIIPGKPFRMGVLLRPRAGWHTYWENPGDAGLATTLEWSLPEGFSASAIDWPPPQRISEDTLAVYGYKGDVFLPVTITPPASLDKMMYPIKVKASWLVCDEICIPESAELTLELPVTDAPTPSEFSAVFAEHDQRRPTAVAQPISYTVKAERMTLAIPAPALGIETVDSALFSPRQSNLVRYAGEQHAAIDAGTFYLIVDISAAPTEPVSGILSVSSGGAEKYFDIALDVPVQAAPVAEPTPVAEMPTSNLWVLLLFAVLGGIILNLMPCVLPVLSLKALALVRKSGGDRTQIAWQGIAYTAGILVSFAVIAGILLGLKQAGEAVGWGYQMQSPPFVGFLIYLLFLVGLNLSGIFHLPVLLGNVGGEIANESSARGSFFTGVLATAVATPCTAPFMASAVGVALTLPPLQAMLIFQALGFGLALPFLLISLIPPAQHLLPKPGAWMETFKQFMAFPLYASIIWLLWVLTLQTGAGGMVVALAGMLVIMLVLWMRHIFKDSHHYRIAALIILLLTMALTLPALGRMEIAGAMMPKEKITGEVNTVEYSKEKLDELRAAGTPVFVDATAAWCLTCQVNARVAIHTGATMQAFRERGVTLMIADWTLRNDGITVFLRGFGASGVPLYVYYPVGGEPIVLPQLLTQRIVIEAISR